MASSITKVTTPAKLDVTFTMSLFCKQGDPFYAVAGLRRIRELKKRFTSGHVRVYVDDSVPVAFVVHAKRLGAYVIFVDHGRTSGRGFMTLMRFLAFDTVQRGLVIALDLQDPPAADKKLSKALPIFYDQSTARFGGRTWPCRMLNGDVHPDVAKAVGNTASLRHACETFQLDRAHVDKTGCVWWNMLDADGFVMRGDAVRTPITPHVRRRCDAYQYADDEMMLVAWMEENGVDFRNSSGSHGFSLYQDVPNEYDIDISGEEILNLSLNKPQSMSLANEVLQWNMDAASWSQQPRVEAVSATHLNELPVSLSVPALSAGKSRNQKKRAAKKALAKTSSQ